MSCLPDFAIFLQHRVLITRSSFINACVRSAEARVLPNRPTARLANDKLA